MNDKASGISREKLMESFAKSVKCGIMYISGVNRNSENFENSKNSINSCSCNCGLIKNSRKNKINADSSISSISSISSAESVISGEGCYCLGAHRYAGEQSERFGGKYIYFCPAGFVFVICPIIKNGDYNYNNYSYNNYNNYGGYGNYNGFGEYRQYLTAGPMSPVNCEDFDIDELIKGLGLNLGWDEVSELVKNVPVIPSDMITHVANLLSVCSRHLSDSEYLNKFIKNDEIYEQQNQIGEYIQNVKAALIKESQSYISYPYDKEKQLVYAIVSNDLANSRKYLNEILGHIFLASANNLDVIKVKAMELSVMISRAALDGGADQSKIFDINIKFLSEFFNYKTIEEICWALTDILRKFTRETFEFSTVKHVDLISKAVSYVKTNYMRKLTLNEVASYVFLSPSYFSKIFKEEMNYYFNDYLNYVRVEKSKMLLLTEKISLVDIADNVGFYDQSYFNKVFKKITGVTPKKYKESNGKIPPYEKPEKPEKPNKAY